jgi:lipopolysaccharide transport system permease protein
MINGLESSNTHTLKQRVVITPQANAGSYWKDLWNYRGLFYFLAWRDILVRYKQTAIGVIWSVLKPLLTILVFSFLGSFLHIDSHGVPRILLVTAAILPWTFFSSAFSDASGSLVANANLISKVYFPKLIVPVSAVIVCLVDFFISFAILLVLMLYYYLHGAYTPGFNLFALPLFLLLALITATGTSLFIAALNVKYRDFRIIIPFIVQFGLYISPVAFSSADIYASPHIPGFLKVIYSMNPMVGVIDGFRWSILGNAMKIEWTGFWISVAISFFFLILGAVYFRRMEKHFADVI